jgi:tripartite-type tricarboxylate transporter receptor subunit TctC
MDRRLRPWLGALAWSLAWVAPGAAADFYSGKTITLNVANTAGGGYDIYARLLGRYLGKYIPGEPNIVVKNQPGAGGKVMSNEMYNKVVPDGLTIGMMARDNPLEPVLGVAAARFTAEGFTWLGTMSSYADDAYGLVIRADSHVKNIEDARKSGPPLVFGGIAFGETSADIILIARAVFRLNLRLVVGYPGSPDINIAIQRGEIDGRAIGISSVQATMGDWWNAGKLRYLVQFGRQTRLAAIADVPTAQELAIGAEDKALVDFAEVPFRIARPFVAPPNVPADRAAILKRAFMDCQRDPAFLKEARDMQLDISPLSGDEVHDLVARIAHTPPSVVQHYKDILASK